MSLRLRKCRIVLLTALVLGLLPFFALRLQAQTPAPAPAPTPAPCAPLSPCPKLAPRLIQMTVLYKKGDQPWQQSDKDLQQLARKRFYLSSCPFNADRLQAASPAPTRRSYYAKLQASPQLIKWLEENNCDTVYCRELKSEEVTCRAGEAACVPEFARAYDEALKNLKGNAELARKWVTNYAPLSAPELRVGFYKEKQKWLDAAIREAERAASLPTGTIRTAMTDRRGVAYFYDLCPGTYYISNLAPVEVDGQSLVWETTAITIKGPEANGQDQLSTTQVFLANVPARKKLKYAFASRKAASARTTSPETIRDKQAGQ
jgi:hypothetical protein